MASQRLVLCLSGGGKPAIAFGAGALIAMRDLGLLRRVKVFSASESGHWLLAFLLQLIGIQMNNSGLTVADRWTSNHVACFDALLSPRQTKDDYDDDNLCRGLLSRTVTFCTESQEWWMLTQHFWSRVGHHSFFTASYLSHMKRYMYEKHWQCDSHALMASHCVSMSAQTERDYPHPKFLFNCVKDGQALCITCFTNDARSTGKDALVEYRSVDNALTIAEVTVACGMSGRIEENGLAITSESGVDEAFGNCLSLDPFGTHAATTYSIKHKLGVTGVFGNEEEEEEEKKETETNTHRLLLVDGFTGMPSYTHSKREVSQAADITLSNALGAVDTANETLRCFKLMPCTCYSKGYENDSSTLAPLFFRAIRQWCMINGRPIRHEAMSKSITHALINWGYLMAIRAWREDANVRVTEPLIGQDEYCLVQAVFGGRFAL